MIRSFVVKQIRIDMKMMGPTEKKKGRRKGRVYKEVKSAAKLQ